MSRLAPRVSVCMAVHNGAAFLVPQAKSILAQLQPSDELVVVDDASTDASEATLRGLGDDRLRLYRNEKNQGVRGSFERALRLASGEILFLSDQDDIWLPGKVAKSLAAFERDSAVTMVASDTTLIDENGETIAQSFFAQRGRFRPGFLHNFAKNKYLGCTLSFRRKMLDYFLPIPGDVPQHDIWFGLLNQLYGNTFFIDEPLVAYRRHGRNASPLRHRGPGQILVWRWRLAKNLIARVASGAPKRVRVT